MSEQELQALLARVSALETKNAELESKFGKLETQVDTVNKFISAITESQSLENTMNEIESVTKQLTNCDKATFYCYDNTNDKFFSYPPIFGEVAASPFDEDLFCKSKSGFDFSINFSIYLLIRLLQFFV